MRPQDLFDRLAAGYEYDPMYGALCNERDQLKAENAKLRTQLADVTESMGRVEERCAKLRELATFALKHIIEFECEEPDRERLRGKPCEDCADYGSSDCPKCMPRMFDVSGIEVSE